MSVIVKSGVPGKVPTSNQLDYGQLALNYADQKMYFKTSENIISRIPVINSTASGVYNVDLASGRFMPWNNTGYAGIHFGLTQVYSHVSTPGGGNGLAHNAYFRDSAWKYLTTGSSSIISLTNGLNLRAAVSGTQDTAITYSVLLDTDIASGSIHRPLSPAFQASSSTSAAIGSDVIFGNVQRNNGNHYNSANGRFTAPVAGMYQFNFNLMVQFANPAGEYRFALYVNGAGNGGHRFIYQKPSASSWFTMSGSGTIYLTAGQYVTVRFETGQTGATTYTDASYNSFSGFLI